MTHFPVFGIVKHEFSKDELRQIVSQLLAKRLLEKSEGEYPIIQVTESRQIVAFRAQKASLVRPDTVRPPPRKRH